MDFIKAVSQTAPKFCERKLISIALILEHRKVFSLNNSLSSSEISSWPRQFPRENCQAKDVRLSISGGSDKSSKELPISSPFGSDKQL